MARSLPLAVLTHALNIWPREKLTMKLDGTDLVARLVDTLTSHATPQLNSSNITLNLKKQGL